MQLYPETIMRCICIVVMSNYIFLQIRTDLDNWVYFSLQLVDSADVVDTVSDFTIKEDHLKFITLEEYTTGLQLFSHFKNIIFSDKMPISKIVELTTNKAPAMVVVIKV